MATQMGEISKLLKDLERQGCTLVLRGSNTVLVRFPDKETSLTIHQSASDRRAIKNIRAIIRRAGLTVPGDK